MQSSVHSFKHQQAVTSCGFSKKTGKYLVSFSYDNHIRIFENYKYVVDYYFQFIVDSYLLFREKAKLGHNCNTGRWVTPFKVAWDPKVENVFACGNMRRSLDVSFFDSDSSFLFSYFIFYFIFVYLFYFCF